MATKPQKMPPPPECLAMIFSRASRLNPATGEKDLLGIWNELKASSFPHHEPNICLYTLMMRGAGVVNFNLVVTLNESEVFNLQKKVGLKAWTYIFSTPIQAVDMMLDLEGGITFPRPGMYQATIFANGADIIARPIAVVRR